MLEDDHQLLFPTRFTGCTATAGNNQCENLHFMEDQHGCFPKTESEFSHIQ